MCRPGDLGGSSGSHHDGDAGNSSKMPVDIGLQAMCHLSQFSLSLEIYMESGSRIIRSRHRKHIAVLWDRSGKGSARVSARK